jgi:poly-gamma-glutamate capsule biosynthesis protein CapA/YwtB (metallophosphatase superfamily)
LLLAACRSASVSRDPFAAVGEAPTSTPRLGGGSGRSLESRAAPAEASLDEGPAPDSAAGSKVVLVAGGDVSFGREVGQRVVENADYTPFSKLALLWADADIRFVNLESQLSEQGGETQSPRHRLIFTGPPGGASALARAKIQVVSTANNHAWDYGRGALFETLANLAREGVRAAGTGIDLEAAYRPVSLDVRGLRVAVVAVTHVWNQGPLEQHEGREFVAWASLPRLRAAVAKAREQAGFVIVSYHGGAEYQDAPSELTRRFAKAAIEAGADAFIGHHPHVIQGVGWVGDRPVFYSLGNLVFGPRSAHPWTRYGMLARIELDASGARRYAVCPYELVDFEPSPFTGVERARFLSHVRLASTAVGGTVFGAPDAHGCSSVEPPAPLAHEPPLPVASR